VGLPIFIISLFLENFYLDYLGYTYLLVICLYGFMLLLNSLWVFNLSKDWTVSYLTIPGVLITHLWYGAKFLHGLLFTKGKKLTDNYGRTE
jgi:hypothetical protein